MRILIPSIDNNVSHLMRFLLKIPRHYTVFLSTGKTVQYDNHGGGIRAISYSNYLTEQEKQEAAETLFALD